MKQSAKTQALHDIKEELKREGKVFIAFRKELNAPMREIVNEQLKQQRTAYCFSPLFSKRKEAGDETL